MNHIVIFLFFLQMIFHYRLLQDTGCNTLCYTVNPCYFLCIFIQAIPSLRTVLLSFHSMKPHIFGKCLLSSESLLKYYFFSVGFLFDSGLVTSFISQNICCYYSVYTTVLYLHVFPFSPYPNSQNSHLCGSHGQIPWGRESVSTPVFWAGGVHEQYSPWGCKESGKTEHFHFHFTFTGGTFVLTHFASTIFAQCLEHSMHLIDV